MGTITHMFCTMCYMYNYTSHMQCAHVLHNVLYVQLHITLYPTCYAQCANYAHNITNV